MFHQNHIKTTANPTPIPTANPTIFIILYHYDTLPTHTYIFRSLVICAERSYVPVTGTFLSVYPNMI